MIIDKEFPATHSMSTSWFGIDKDGKVALLEFNENGPVPTQCLENNLEDLVSTDFARIEDKVAYLNYSLEQASVLMSKLEFESPTVKNLAFDNILKIDTSRTKEFIRICRSRTLERWEKVYYHVISEELGVYLVDCDWDRDTKMYLIKSGIVQKLTSFDLWCTDEFNHEKGETEFTPGTVGYPFYLYQQAYVVDELMKLTYAPPFPMVEDPLPASITERAIRFPFSFNEHNRLQIAEYARCTSYSRNTKTEEEDNRDVDFEILPLENGNDGIFRSDIIGIPSCENCQKCVFEGAKRYYHFHTSQYAIHPTVLIFTAPEDMDEEYLIRERLSQILQYGLIQPITQGLPTSSKSWVTSFEVRKLTANQDYKVWFSNCKHNLEYSVSKLLPNAIIATDKALEYLASEYKISENKIEIESKDFPLFSLSEYDIHKDMIKSLAQQEYRGVRPERIRVMPKDESSTVNDNES